MNYALFIETLIFATILAVLSTLTLGKFMIIALLVALLWLISKNEYWYG